MLRITAIVIVLCASAMVAQANLIVNGDFETGDLTGYNTDLQASGVFFGVTTNNVPAGSGTYTYEFDTGASVNNHYGNLHQGGQPGHQPRIPLPNSNPHFSADVLCTSQSGSNQAAPMLQMYNAAGDWVALIYWSWGGGPTSWGTGIHGGPDGPLAVIANNMSGSNGQWTHIDADVPALYESYFPTGTPGQRWADFGVESVWFTFQTWAATDGTSSVAGFADNFVLTDVPEPMTLSLLALGMVGILRRKRS